MATNEVHLTVYFDVLIPFYCSSKDTNTWHIGSWFFQPSLAGEVASWYWNSVVTARLQAIFAMLFVNTSKSIYKSVFSSHIIADPAFSGRVSDFVRDLHVIQ